MSSCSTDELPELSQLETFASSFERQVEKNPNQIAIEFEGTSWTYCELNSQANRIAAQLVERGFQREDRIGICMDRSTAAIVSMLGILKSGCAFVPLDPEFPTDRLEFIVRDADIKLILCDTQYRSLYKFSDSDSIEFVHTHTAMEWKGRSSNLELDIPSNSLAYVMYTSGSTGKPKGVQIEHRSLTTYCLADIEVYQLVPEDRTLQFSTLNFDIAIEEIFPPLMVGSTVVVRPRSRAQSQNELSDLIESHQISALHIATAYWNEWVDLMLASKATVPHCLRLAIATGEKISVEHYRRWKSLCTRNVLWCNAYGPTETTVTCTVFIPEQHWDGDQMPIGKPLPGYTAYILDDSHAKVADGQTGNLWIGGEAVARGYLNRPELNAKAFVDVRLEGDCHPTRLYRTGDLARWLPSGDIEFSGRIDHQMKIGSYRIEPGEIEAVLALFGSVRESLVICPETDGQKYLAAYVVLNDLTVTAYDIASFLRQRLPVYMVPSRYTFLESFPKTINGKIDRRALPPPELGAVPRKDEFTAAQSELERELADIWSNVLKIPQIGRDDDFFQLGGSSLLVTRVLAQIMGKLQRKIPVRDFFANPTIATLSRHLSATNAATSLQKCADPTVEQQSAALRSRLPRIQCVTIRSKPHSLAGVLYPAFPQEEGFRNHAVLLCNAYGHEHERAFRNLQQLAVMLSQSGFDVMRFDYTGTGNSAGSAAEINTAQWQRDVKAAIRLLRQPNAIDGRTASEVSVVGIRIGATLAATTAIEGIKHAILWDPVCDGKRYLESLRTFHSYELASLTRYSIKRSSASGQLMGYPFPPQLQTELDSLNLNESVAVLAANRWVVTSKDYQVVDPGATCMEGWQQLHCDDELYWDKHQYMQSAFSSRHAYQLIHSILTK